MVIDDARMLGAMIWLVHLDPSAPLVGSSSGPHSEAHHNHALLQRRFLPANRMEWILDLEN